LSAAGHYEGAISCPIPTLTPNRSKPCNFGQEICAGKTLQNEWDCVDERNLSVPPDIPPDILELILRESNALETKIAARISDFGPLVERQYPLLLKLCRKATHDPDLATELVHHVFSKFFRLIWNDMWVGDLRKFTTPEAWFTHAARNAIADVRRERSRRKHGERPKRNGDSTGSQKLRFGYHYAYELPQIEDEDGLQLDVIQCAVESVFVIAQRSPEERVFDREILMRYLTALCQLTPLQRAVYILYQDELLQPEEQYQLLSLDARATRILVETTRARPHLRLADVASLLGRKEGTLSSELTRAKVRLQVELSDLRWRKPRELAVPKWSREFLVGFSGHSGSLRSLQLGLEERAMLSLPSWVICARDKEYVRAMPWPTPQHESLCPPKQERLYVRSMDIVPGWVRAPEPDSPEDIRLLEIVRDRLKTTKSYQTIANELNAALVPPRFGNVWHRTAVRLIAMRAGFVKPRPPLGSVPSRRKAPKPIKVGKHRSVTSPKPRKISTKQKRRSKLGLPTPRSAPRPTKAAQDPSLKDRKLARPSIKRTQRSKPAQKAPRNAVRPTKTAKDPSLKERKPGKPSIKRARRSKPVQPVPRSALGPIKAGQGRSVTSRKPRKSSASVAVKRGRLQRDATAANAARRVAAQPQPRKPAQQSKRVRLPSTVQPSARTSRNTPSPRRRPGLMEALADYGGLK
jgi:RNA polymerase sigma factor (sigma-70 family)